MNKISTFIYPIVFFLLTLFIWQEATQFFAIEPYLLPSPLAIFQSFFKNIGVFFQASSITFAVTIVSLLFSVFIGSLLSILIFFNKTAEKTISPFLVLIQITPIISIIPLLIIWFKSNTFVTLTICATICSVFPIITSLYTGFQNTDPRLILIFDIYNGSKWKKLIQLYLPSSLPYFLNGLQISSALALIGCVSAEFIAGTGGNQSGIAYQLLMAGYNLQTDKLFAALFALILLGIVIHLFFTLIKKIALRNYS